MTASVPCVPAATFVTWRCWSALPIETTFERPPSFELAPIATELDPAVTCGLSVPLPFMSVATPLLLAAVVELLLMLVESDDTWLFTLVDREATVLLVLERPVDSELTLVWVDVDSDVRLLLVVLRPVDSEPTAVDVEVESEATLALVAPSPVDSEATALLVANSWLPLTASVLLDVIWPAATLVTCRS